MAIPTWTTGQVLTASDVNLYFVPIVAIKTSTESVTSSTTLQNDDQLVVALAANSSYHVEASIMYDGAAAGDFKMAWTGPSGATINGQMVGNPFSGAGGTDVRVISYTAFTTAESWGATGAGTTWALTFNGVVAIGSTAGSLQLQWSQDTSNATATRVFGGSFISARRIS